MKKSLPRRMGASMSDQPGEPSLGLATTEELFRELICRLKLNTLGTHTNLLDIERALTLAEMLGGLSAPEREYRTVDGSRPGIAAP